MNIHYDLNVLVDIGFTLVAAFLGSKLFQRFGFPQVVGFISVGVILGNVILNLIPLELITELSIISLIALGLIGFDQLIGPIFVKFAIQRAGEIGTAKTGPEVWATEGTPE